MPRLYEGTPWEQHKQKWIDCSLCPLCEVRKHVVLYRGNIPCHVLFIGEAPGDGEDVLGKPFQGPAGKLLDQQIAEALHNLGSSVDSGGSTPDGKFIDVWQPMELRIGFTNLVCCIPKDAKGGKKVGEPPKESIAACHPRLTELVHLVKPKMIVLVGDLAKKEIVGQAHFSYEDGELPWLHGNEFLEFISITHPAAILRAEIVRRELMYQRVVVTLENVFRELT